MRVLERIREIRKLLHGCISAIARGDEEEKSRLLPAINLLLIDAASRQRLIYNEGVFRMDQVDAPGDLMSPVWKTVHSLAHLLTKHDMERIRECPQMRVGIS